MLPRKPRHLLYAILLIALSIVCTSAIANTKVSGFINEIALVLEKVSDEASVNDKRGIAINSKSEVSAISHTKKKVEAAVPMFMTILQGADEEVGCSTNGLTVARFNLCGDSDDRAISLTGSYGSVSWQILNGSCTPDINEDCPNTSTSCYTQVATGSTFNLDASTIPATTGSEFRVVADGTNYYFKVKKSTITQTFVKNDFICNVPGRIQITNLSSAYEFSIDNGSGFGPWQGPIFNGLTPGTYIVKARLRNTPNTCEYPYEPITIDQIDMDIEATFTDALCAGDTGTITVTPTAGIGPYKYTLLNSSGVAQEFTAFIPDNPYTFSAVGFGTYIVQVETQQCTGDPLNGIDPPRQDLDTVGDPIVIGNGLSPLDASTEVNSSFGCSTITSVDITVNTSGGSAPYTFTVNGGPSQPAYTGSTTYPVTSPGTYDFLITDGNGCTITASADVEDLLPPDVTANGVDGTCTNGGARINFNVVDARGYNLSYRVNSGDPWDPNPSISVPATPGGTLYDEIEVRYQQGGFECTLDLPDITVTSVGAIVASATKVSDRTCDGSGGTNGGQIDFTAASGGFGSGYTYSIDGLNFSPTLSYTDLVPGIYTPIVEDGDSCRLELTPIEIFDVDPPTDLDFFQSNINCTAGTTDLQLVPTSSAAIDNYSIIAPSIFDNGNNDTFTGLLTSTSYIFQITDVNNCTYTEAFTPAQISTIRARVRSGGDLRVCTGATDGTGTFLIDGFANNYTYNINGGPESAPQNDLEVVLPPSGAGTYTITVTDVDTGCTDTASFDIEEPATPLNLGGDVTDMSCANGNLGRVRANASGGWGTYRYTLQYPSGSGVPDVGPKSGRNFGNLNQGTDPLDPTDVYTLIVEDAEGCTATFTFDLVPIDSPTIAFDAAASNLCYEPVAGATVAVTSTAGTAPLASHQYRINGGPLQASPVFTGVGPGNYTIEVVDGNDCNDAINVTVNPQLRVNTSIETEIPCGSAPGQIRVRVQGGYTSGAGPKQYEFSLNGGPFGGATPLTSNNFLFDTTTPGDYVFRITDNEGCVAESNPITLNPPQSIDAASVAITPVSCGASDNGIVVITPDATSGIPPYEISFNGGPWGTQSVFSNLPAGTYPFLVRDARGCETLPADAVVIVDPTASPDTSVSPVTATCSLGLVSGGIDINSVTNGTANFTFIVEDFLGNEIARLDNVDPGTLPVQILDPALIPGTYRVVTLDANGCRDEDTVIIDQTTLDVVPDPVTPVCNVSGFSNTVEIVGGVGPFLIRLANDPNPPVIPSSPPRRHTFNGLQFGVTYTVEVTDQGTGCIYLEEIPPVDGPTPLDVTASSTPGFCDVNRNGEITYEVTGFAIGDDLRIELLNNDDGTRIDLHNPVTTVADPFADNTLQLPGDYQIIVTNLTDNCTAATGVIIEQNLPSIDILNLNPANCNADGSITVQGSGGAGGPYTFAFMDAGVSPAPTDFGTATTFEGPAGNYDVYVMDSSGCTSFAIAEIIPLSPVLPIPTFVVINQCDPTSTSFDITVQVPSTVDTPRFTLGGDEQFGVLNGTGTLYEYTFNVSTPGDYIVDVIDADGCTSQGTATVFEFLFASVGSVTQPSCADNDGELTITTSGGSGNFDYELTGPIGTVNQSDDPVFLNLVPGTYAVTVTDRDVFDISGNCTVTINNIEVEEAIDLAILSVQDTDISCNGETDGTITVNIDPANPGDPPLVFTLFESGTTNVIGMPNSTGFFDNLGQGTYDVVVVSAKNCEDRRNGIVIDEPVPFSITASAPDFTCEPGTNRFSSTTITVTVVDAGTVGSGYQYSITGFSNYQSLNTFEIVDNGSPQNITVYAIDGNGCRAQFNVPTINPPTDVVPSIIEIDPLNCRDDERVRIQVTGTSDFTVSAVSAVSVGPWTNTPGNDYVDVFLPAAGDYIFEVQDNEPNGCAYPMPVHTVDEPLAPTVTIAEEEPVSCFTPGNDGELSIEVTNYNGQYTYNVYNATDTGKTTILATGTFDTANNPERITGLTGGNFFVEVISTDAPFCTADSNSATIRTPNGDLDLTLQEIGNVSCNDNTGIIEATASGGWDTSPYEYRLLEDTGSGFTEIVPFSNNNRFENLSSSSYQVEVRDIEGCTFLRNLPLPSVPQIDAGIREPQALVCPNGNNAILEAFDPTTGDAATATAGATGGVAGAGYNYRLLYLNSNDNTDIASTSGLQNDPTFIGASGGFISEGWYAIEVSSSYDCTFVTPPYYVDPPPPIAPLLVQTQVPGCGGQGEIELRIENPEPTFTYEFQPIENGVVVGPWENLTGTAQRFPGDAGITYQFDVRKTNAANTCLAVRSNGITMTDATGITILPNQPDDISCASELDGRIESFVNGGVGNEMYTLYVGDPVDAFNPVAPRYDDRPAQPFGTFEGLDQGTNYYIAVTSGATCSDIAGPFGIIRPDPILFTSDSTPVTCTGEEDGTITLEVTSGGEGLIQFAIEPNFNEFFSDPTTPGIYTFDELAAGDYEILIQDENGCFEKDVITVMQPDELQLTNIQTTPELCIGANDGTVVFDIEGGTPFNDPLVSPTPYFEYKIEMIDPVNETGIGVFTPYDGEVIPNLQGGASYALYIQDASGCSTSDVFTIGIGVDLTAEPLVQYGCEGIFPNSTSTIEMMDNSLLPRLLFALDVDDITLAETNRTWGDLTPGDHTVYIYHENGCINSVDFSIDAYDPLTLTAVKTGPDEITATAEGGFGGYEYFFNGESYGTENMFITNVSGTVEVRVVDQNGCVAVAPIPFEFTGMLEIPNFFTPDGDNNNDLWVINGREFFPNIEVKIYDRYGRVVAILDQVKNWDGTYEGNELPTGDYWYVVNQNDARNTRFVGHFTLYR